MNQDQLTKRGEYERAHLGEGEKEDVDGGVGGKDGEEEYADGCNEQSGKKE